MARKKWNSIYISFVYICFDILLFSWIISYTE